MLYKYRGEDNEEIHHMHLYHNYILNQSYKKLRICWSRNRLKRLKKLEDVEVVLQELQASVKQSNKANYKNLLVMED